MGGYSSFPICLAASLLRIKFIIYENNLIIGKANKYLLPFAEKILVSHRELEGISERYSFKVFEIGNIIREDILNFKILDQDDNNLNNIKILILGQAKGAKVFAEELPQIFEKKKESQFNLKIYQQCQKSNRSII